jgi:hypothetical protein
MAGARSGFFGAGGRRRETVAAGCAVLLGSRARLSAVSAQNYLSVFYSRRQSSTASKQRHDRLLDCHHRSGEACEGGHAGSDCAQEPEHSVLVWLVFLQLPIS